MQQLQFNFYPIPSESAGSCLFRDHSVERAQVRMHGESYTQSVLVFLKIGPVQLSSSGMVGASQNHPFLALGK